MRNAGTISWQKARPDGPSLMGTISRIAIIYIFVGSATAALGQSREPASVLDIPAACRAVGVPMLSDALSAIANATRHSAKPAPTVNRDELFECEIIARDLVEINLAKQEIRTGKDIATKDTARVLLQVREKEISALAVRFSNATY